jgi:hypothetical protein
MVWKIIEGLVNLQDLIVAIIPKTYNFQKLFLSYLWKFLNFFHNGFCEKIKNVSIL